MLKKIILMMASTVSVFALHTAEININDLDLEVGAKFDIGQFNQSVKPETMFIGAKFFNPDASHSQDNISKINPYVEGNFLIMREIGNKGMSLGMGAKLNYTQVDGKDFSSLPLGIEFAYTIPAPKLIPMSINGSVYYAPKVLSFADAKNYLEYRIHYDVEFIENAGVTIGYRSMNINFDFVNSDINYNTSWYFGFKVKF
jgi:hypothetical protein